MNRKSYKSILVVIFCLNFFGKQLLAQETPLFEDEFKSSIEEIVNNYHEKRITNFKITCTDIYGSKKYKRGKYYFSIIQDTIIEIKRNRKGAVIDAFITKNKRFYYFGPSIIKKQINRNNSYTKQYDSLGFQNKNHYVIYNSDTLLEVQHVTKYDTLKRIVFENYRNFGHYHHGIILPDKYERTFYSGDTTIKELYKRKDGLWQLDLKAYYAYSKYQVVNENEIEYVENNFQKNIYFDNISRNEEFAYRRIVRVEYDKNKLIKRIIQAYQGLNLEEKKPIYSNDTQVLDVEILNK